MFKKYITLLIFISLFSISSEIYAQDGDCVEGVPGPPCPPNSPIGGGAGVAILLAAGVAYGIKKVRE